MAAQDGRGLRVSVLRFLFGALYRSRTLYWLASTVPFAGQWRTWQRLALPRLVGHDVLEVGCGPGTLLGDLAAAGYVCAAIDRSPQMVAAARAALRRRRISLAEVPVTRADVRHLPFSEAAFDSVVSTFPTEYIFDREALREIARVLRPGGRLVVVLGAAILPDNVLLLPFVALQTLVYGRATVAGAGANRPENDILARRLLEAGLVPARSVVRGPFWEAVVYMADKPHEAARARL